MVAFIHSPVVFFISREQQRCVMKYECLSGCLCLKFNGDDLKAHEMQIEVIGDMATLMRPNWYKNFDQSHLKPTKRIFPTFTCGDQCFVSPNHHDIAGLYLMPEE